METRFDFTIDLTGLDRFSDALALALETTADFEGDATVRDAQSRAPVSPDGSHGNPPGFMRDQTGYEVRGGGTSGEPLTLEIYALAPYSGFVDMGTRFQSAQPWFTPAIDQLIARLPERIRQDIENAERAG